MKVKSDILTSPKATLLGGALLMAMFPLTSAMAQNANINAADWYWNGMLEAGGNIFVQKPPSGFGRTSTDPFWLTPNTTDSNAKMDEYGKVPRGLFLDVFGLNAGTKDGRFALDFWADNIGMDNQRYRLDLYEPGRQYFNIGWDKIPHLLSSSAKSIFDGAGNSRLTVNAATRSFLQSQSVPAQNATNRSNIDQFIGGVGPTFGGAGFPAPETNIELKTLREIFTAGYRNTMLDDWDFNVDYSHEHRTGTRPLGIAVGFGGGPGAPRPNGSVEVPQPLDDRTQNANASGEYVGTTPWGTRWNTSVQYSGSYFTNENKSIDVDNPFCITCSATGGGTRGANLLRYGLYPDNNANGVTWNTAVDLPIFKSRYTSNVQYMMFRQNDAFIDTATNGLTYGPGATQIRPYPATSLNGEVNAFLTNNVLYSHLTHDLTNTARVRYYDRKDNTPTLVFANYAYADSGVNAALPLTREPHSYSRLNIEDDLKWQASRAWAFGLGYFFERYVYENGEVDATNEPGAKAFINWTPWTWATARASAQYSQRRYNSWLATATDPAANAMRQFFVQNRNRTKASAIVEVQLTKDITISPNGGLRWDEYPTDAVLNAALQTTNSLGTQYDRSWNVGADLGYRATPDLRFTFGYNYEEHYLYMQSCCGGSATGVPPVPFNDNDKWSSKITQKYNTFMASGFWSAIPGKLDFKADYIVAVANEANDTTGCTANLTACTGKNFVTDPAVVWPDEHNIFQRFSILMKYYVDPMVVKQMGWFGEVTLKARYTWEQNRNTNWATDNFTPYSPSAADAGGTDITNGGRSLFLAYNNPNYTAQIIALGVGIKW